MTTLQERPNGTPDSSNMNLEKEFTCSICTDILYRPLTLLDCLHTFCGGCLKEWFGFQKAAIERKMQQEGRVPAILYTCPSCRAEVRNTKNNATVTSLLEMYLKMHPEKEKGEEEKKQLDAAYKRGDSVLPPPPRLREERHAHEHDITQAMQESTISATSSSSRSSETRADSARAGRLAAETNGADRVQNALEYQSSIRSILSGTGFDSIATEEEVMQLVMQEGLLNGIDLHNLTAAQEDEIIGQIALAYRRKERARAREAEEARRRETLQGRQRELSQTRQRDTDRPQSRQRDSSQTRRRDTAERRPRQNNTSHPPVSRPHLLDSGSDTSQRNVAASTHQTTGCNTTQTTRRRRHTSAERSDRSATRSASGLTLRPEPENRLAEGADTRRTTRRTSRSTERRATDSQARSITEAWRSGDATTSRNGNSSRNTAVSVIQVDHIPALPASQTRFKTSSGRAPPLQAVSSIPELSCKGCGKQHIECEVHYSCNICMALASGIAYNLCRPCYRRGKGCPHWTGFGRHNAPSRQALRAERYVRGEDGNVTHQRGKFCDTCGQSADECYWSCDICNDGEWGYCDKCAMQGRVCSHSLLPTTIEQTTTGIRLHPLSMTDIACNSCYRNITQLNRYLHCPTCYVDLCEGCLHAARQQDINSDRPDRVGWRRCPDGHRMQSIELRLLRRDDSVRHLERTIYMDVEGGWASKSAHDARRTNGQPTVNEEDVTPHVLRGDIDRTMVAIWTRIPDDGVEDELGFPRGAEIREVKEINEDWSVGVYCRMMGLFPSNHVRPKS